MFDTMLKLHQVTFITRRHSLVLEDMTSSQEAAPAAVCWERAYLEEEAEDGETVGLVGGLSQLHAAVRVVHEMNLQANILPGHAVAPRLGTYTQVLLVDSRTSSLTMC